MSGLTIQNLGQSHPVIGDLQRCQDTNAELIYTIRASVKELLDSMSTPEKPMGQCAPKPFL